MKGRDDVQDLSLHLLDIAENSVRAAATKIEISIEELIEENRLIFSIKDNGKGMNGVIQQQVTDPFFTTRTTRKVGLGIPLLKQHCEAAGGFLDIQSQETVGTQVVAVMQYDHIDRVPLGDLASTWVTLIRLHPEIHWHYGHIYKTHDQEKQMVLDTKQMKEILKGVPVNDPMVIEWMKEQFEAF